MVMACQHGCDAHHQRQVRLVGGSGSTLTQLLSQVQPHLRPGEQQAAIISGGSHRPLSNLLVVTNARVFALEEGIGPKFELHALQLASVETGWRHVEIKGLTGESIKFQASKEDIARAAAAALRLKGGMLDVGVAEELSSAQAARASVEEAWATVPTVGAALRTKLNRATWKALRGAARDGEVPLFIITGADGSGVLAAFSDRCMILKAGAVTGFLAGATGGSRQATFLYSQITGIEYNAGIFNGVLEVLTASYQGTTNKDFWNTGRTQNSDANDPWTLSNTLPLDKMGHKEAQPQINELRRLVGESKQVQVVVSAPEVTGSRGSLGDELAKLAELRSQGVLDDAEFAEAKKAVLARFA